MLLTVGIHHISRISARLLFGYFVLARECARAAKKRIPPSARRKADQTASHNGKHGDSGNVVLVPLPPAAIATDNRRLLRDPRHSRYWNSFFQRRQTFLMAPLLFYRIPESPLTVRAKILVE